MNEPLIVMHAAPAEPSLLIQVTPFLSTLLGALIAGTTGYLLQRRQFDQQRRIVEEDKLELDEATGFSAMLKINRTLTTLVQVRQLIDEGISLCTMPKCEDLWAKTEAFSSDPPRIDVSMEEIVFVRRLGDVEAMNGMVDLESINNSYVDNMRTYSELRDSIGRRMVELGEHRVEGTTVSGSYTPEQMAPLRPDMARANRMLLDIRRMVDDHEPVVIKLFQTVHDLTRKKLGNRAPEFAIPKQAGEVFRPKPEPKVGQ